ncbi:bis(5'-nucleosyl)-tetraphosphatase [Lactobacillus hamsteri]|uniref:Bis(5'-nucleosyl)-tetraphosphatase [asymmetrical] n=1 Tax=Lactobacillus hamsteri DSM 5661 = JCM 6256 TaxID=1423754 RepID=A0A0R1YDS8_9LACO|nr:NUDIX domain-containing protein [Lactobacillus hamsteri]KRM40525.1 nudix family protein [Lactobacillus hamsteri DSM 5661 = JCM 6256]
MILEHSAGAVIYRKRDKVQQLEYLIVQSIKNNNWGFPKGHLEGDEAPKEAAQREVLEESGLKPIFDFNFVKKTKYALNAYKNKEITFYLAKAVANQKVKLQREEIKAGKWVTLDEAKKYLTEHDKMRILKAAQEYIEN